MSFKKGTVLVIDDEPSNIDVLSSILRDDYKVIAATSGTRGLQLAQQQNTQPDIVLLDIKMPGLNGYDTCKELKKNPETEHIPVIFVTADADIKSEEKGLLLGAVDYITKPFNSMLILARVRNHILLKQSQDDLHGMVKRATADLQSEREKLAKSEKLYRTLMESAPDSILLVNEQGNIEMVNNAFEDMFGYLVEEIIGKKIETLVPDEHMAAHISLRDGFLKKPVIRSRVTLGKLLGKRKDGELFPVDISLSPVETDKGTMIVADVRDMSEEQRMQDQLRQAQKMEAIGQLTGGIAHDFNNILNSILGFSELAIKHENIANNEKLANYMGIIKQSGERARDLVKQMLAYSRGNYTGSLKVTDVASVIHEVLKMLRPMLPTTIDIELDIDENTPNILADPLQVNQVIMNMCINARDALQEQGKMSLSLKKVKVSNQSCSSCEQWLNDDFVEVAIRDNGEGIHEENIRKIFDPFFTTKEVGKGSGMGLSVVHGIIHTHGGHILVDSQPGKGTVFRLLLPYVESRNVESNNTDSQAVIEVDGKSSMIMIVDDETFICSYLKSLLSENNFRVETFTSSSDSLAYFEAHKDEIDLVITDQTMPEVTGYELSRRMLDIKPDLAIIMQTGFSTIVDDKSARALGIKAFVNKPVKNSELLKVIKNTLNL